MLGEPPRVILARGVSSMHRRATSSHHSVSYLYRCDCIDSESRKQVNNVSNSRCGLVRCLDRELSSLQVGRSSTSPSSIVCCSFHRDALYKWQARGIAKKFLMRKARVHDELALGIRKYKFVC